MPHLRELRAHRFHEPRTDSQAGLDVRSPFRHDRDRILYSPEFRRLGQVTQVLSPEGNHLAHNRLTHTLEVAQIGRSIAETLLHVYRNKPELIDLAGGLDPDVVEAAALAHDIGHPPFGHTTEAELNDILQKGIGEGFEGNAQTFRIVSKLAVHSRTYPGLNLTRATLAAVQKYPWLEGKQGYASRKWGAYESEAMDLDFCRAHLSPEWRTIPQNPTLSLRTLEAEIMDWSDDVAYAIHDVEDFFKSGRIPLDRLGSDVKEFDRFLNYHMNKNPATQEIDEDHANLLFSHTSPIAEPFTSGRNSKTALRLFSTILINRFITALRIVVSDHNTRGWDLEMEQGIRAEVRLLKSLLGYYVIEDPGLLSVRFGYRKIIRHLFEILMEIAMAKDSKFLELPVFMRERISDPGIEKVERMVADFIAGMTDMQVISYYRRLTGISFGDSFDVIV